MFGGNVSDKTNSNIEPLILRIGQVSKVVGLPASSIYRLINTGEFPAPVKLSKRASGWRFSDVSAWVDSLERSERSA